VVAGQLGRLPEVRHQLRHRQVLLQNRILVDYRVRVVSPLGQVADEREPNFRSHFRCVLRGVEHSHGECAEQRVIVFLGSVWDPPQAVALELPVKRFQLLLHAYSNYYNLPHTPRPSFTLASGQVFSNLN